MLLLCWWRNLLIGWVILSILIVDVAFTTTFTTIIVTILSPQPSSSPQTVSPQHSPLLNYFFITITFYYFPTPNHTSPTTTSPSFNYKSSHTDSTGNYTSLNIDANYPSIQRYSSLSTLSSSGCWFFY